MELKFTTELGQSYQEHTRWASIKVGEQTVFTELVYDTPETPAEHNIKLVFVERLRRLLEGE